ncbi:MAG: MFS transporter, partial [Carbonactinosporaceae bacterium]
LPGTPPGTPPGRLLRSGLAWQVTLFMGLQSLLFYATLSWLPTLYRDRGADATDAGLLLSLATFAGIASALAAPVIGQRRRDQRAVTAATVLLTASGLAGTITAPLWAAPLFMIMLGLGQGAAIALALLFMILRAPDAQTSAALSGMAQTIGYLLAATGPLVAGLLHTASGGWTVPVLFLLALAAVEFGVGLAAARDRTLQA